MNLQLLLRLGVCFFLVTCADDEPAEEPVQPEAAEQDAEGESQENSALDEYGEAPAEPEVFEEEAEDSASPMIEEEENGGGIISGGATPQPAPSDGNIMLDCEQTKIPAKPGHVTYGCYAKLSNGQKASRIRGQWRPFSNSGERIPMRELIFANKGYDVTFEVTKTDAAQGFQMKRQ